jgi:LuxR family quorum-sensing system transcriptional regulator CciR
MTPANLKNEMTAIREAPTFSDLHLALKDTRAVLGFDHYAFLQWNNSRTDSGILLQDYPERWVSLQSETLGFIKSPVVRAASRFATPFRWDELTDLISVTEQDLAHLEMCAGHGIVNGYTIPLHAPGQPSAMFNFVIGPDKQIEETIMPLAMFVASSTYVSANRIRRQLPFAEKRLSDVDLRIVTMLCRGQSKARIAQKLEVERKEIAAAVSRACRHYRVGTQTEMIVNALWQQSVRFEDVIQ